MSGVSRLRQARSAPKTMPRMGHGLVDHSGIRGTGVNPHPGNVDCGSGLAPKKSYPNFDYPQTPVPRSNIRSAMNGDKEGKIRARTPRRGSSS